LPLNGTLFFNPSSGAKLKSVDIAQLKTAARAAGLDVIDVQAGVDIAGAVRQRMQQGQRVFVAAGGDGTINHVIQPLVHADASLGVLPIGTYNHFARDLGIPPDWPGALEVVMNGATRQVDAARINERFFVNNVSFGLYPELVARREAKGRDYPRWKARLQAAWSTLRKYPHVTVNVETAHHQEAIRTHALMISNNPYDLSRLGVEALRESMSAGMLSVYWLPHLSRLALISFGAHYLAGQVREAPGFRSFRTAKMKVHAAHLSLRIGIDGEVFTLETPMTITSVPASLLVKVPRDQTADRGPQTAV
jgi:diacylglycerol kinase family enzyme